MALQNLPTLLLPESELLMSQTCVTQAFLIVYDTDTISLPNKVFLQKNNCLQHSSQKE